jgi:hypothetical protein
MPPARGGTRRSRCFSPADQAGNPESGVATNKERLLPRRRVVEPARGVLGCTPQRLALLDNILAESYVYQPIKWSACLQELAPSSSNRARMRGAVATNKEQLLARP